MSGKKAYTPTITPSHVTLEPVQSSLATGNSDTHYQKGDHIGGRYQVYEVIDKGGMSEVYLCLDLESNELFALKTFKKKYLANPNIRRFFEQEIRIWIALERSQHIVRCLFMDVRSCFKNVAMLFFSIKDSPLRSESSPHYVV